MSDNARYIDTPLTGKCLCGGVSVTLTRAHREVDVCHCTMCQTWNGSMYAGIEADDFVIEGEEHITSYASSDWASRAFCSKCGSHLWYKFEPTGNRTFVAGMFDLPEGVPIKHQIFVDEKQDWFDIAQKTPMKTGAQIIAEAEAAGFTFE